MTKVDTQAVEKAIEQMTPKSLDDVIRENRELAKLYLSTDEEILALHAEIEPRQPKEIIDDWRLVTLFVIPLADPQMMLLGTRRSNGHTRITSRVRQIDLDRGFVITDNSVYQMGTRGNGEPPFQHLALVCSAFHSWGFGRLLGTPAWFL